MTERMYQIPDRIYKYVLEHPGSETRDIVIGVKGRFKRSDIAYFRNTLEMMCDRMIAYSEDGHWFVDDNIDFDMYYYGRRPTIKQEEIVEFLEEHGPSSAQAIDSALEYNTSRGCYHLLLHMIDTGLISREKDEHGIWLYKAAE